MTVNWPSPQHLAFAELHDLDHFAQVRPPFVDDPGFDIEFKRLHEALPVSIHASGPKHPDRRRQARRPGRVDQGAEFEHMVGVQMRHEDKIERLQVQAGVGQPARHAEPAIDDDGPPAEFQ